MKGVTMMMMMMVVVMVGVTHAHFIHCNEHPMTSTFIFHQLAQTAKSTCQLDNVVDCLSRVPNCSSFMYSKIFENNDTYNTVKGYFMLCKDEVGIDVNFDAVPNTLEELFKIGVDNVFFHMDVDYFDSEGFSALFQCVLNHTNNPDAFVDCINGGPA